MILETIPSGPIETNSYLLGCSKTKQACIIDAPLECLKEVEPLLKRHGLTVSKILLTHSHWDHIAEAFALKEKFNALLLIHPLDADNLISPGADKLPLVFPVKGVKPDGFLNDKDLVQVGDLSIQIIFTPGHTPGGVSFYLPNEKLLFSGDTLFKGTMGRVDFPTSSPSQMRQSLKTLSDLPSETKVFPGHGPSTTIGEEKSWMQRSANKGN